MLVSRAFVAILAAASLTGCVQTMQQPLDSAYHEGFHIQSVTVTAGKSVETPSTLPELERRLAREADFYPVVGPALRMDVTIDVQRLATGGGAMITGDVASFAGPIRLIDAASGRQVAEYQGVGAEYFGGLLGLARMTHYNNHDHLMNLFVANAYKFAYDNPEFAPKFAVFPQDMPGAKDRLRPVAASASKPGAYTRWKGETGECGARDSERRRYLAELTIAGGDAFATIEEETRGIAMGSQQAQAESRKARASGPTGPDGRFELSAPDLGVRLAGAPDPDGATFDATVQGCKMTFKRQTPFRHVTQKPAQKGT